MLTRKLHLGHCIATALVLLVGGPSWAANPEGNLAILELTLNEVPRGDALVVLRGNDVLIHVDALHAAGITDIHGRVEKIAGKTFVPLSSITPKVTFKVDEASQKLVVVAHPEMFGKAVIDLTNQKPAAIEYHTDTSAFVNYSWTLKDFAVPSGFLEGGLSVGGALLSSTVFGSMDTGVVRGLSNLVYDDRENLIRVTVGDSFAASGELGTSAFLGGISISRNFGIDPYFIPMPSMGFTGTALTPSILDVWVNGTRLRSMNVAPGPFQVQNLPVMAGTGNIRYVLRDAFGQERAVDARYSQVATQLGKGRSDFTYAVGLRRYDMGVDSLDYRELVGLGAHRVGITDKVTVGARVEGTADLVSGGATAQFVLPFGHASFSAAASSAAGGRGAAGVARIGYWSRKFIGMAMVQAMSPFYSTASLSPADDRHLLEARVTASIAPVRRFSLSIDSALAIPRDVPPQFRFGATVNVNLARNFQLLLGANGIVSSYQAPWAEVSGMLSYAFDSGVVASAGARTTPTIPEAFATINRPITKLVDSGFRASGTMGQHPRGDILVESQAEQGRFMATVTSDEYGTSTRIQVSGAVVALKGAGLFLTRPLQNGFSVLQVPGVRGVQGYLENQELGRTDEDGNLIIPNMLSYYGSRVRVAGDELPLDYDIDSHERIVAPPFRGGALVRFGVKRLRLYRGRAQIWQHGQAIVPAYGEIEVVKEKESASSPLAQDGAFELPDLTAGRFRAKILYSGGTCEFEFDAPPSLTPIVDLGTITCEANKKGE